MEKAKITVHPEFSMGRIDPRLYSGYLEPIGNWVYGGVWNPDHESADDMGFRTDMLKAIRELGLPAVRLPGGNFISGWDWRESIGTKEKRKQRLDLAWRQYEPNIFGHDEYMEWSRRAGVDPLYTINLGSSGIESAIQCIEYTNHEGGTHWSDLRKANGYEKPHAVKTWYLGNEMDGPWQIHSYEKDPASYGIKAHEISKALKWVDPSIETVVCGTSSPLNRTYPQWDIQVLEQCYETVDYISLHYYHNAGIGDIAGFLNASSVFEDFINTSIASCDHVQAKMRHPRKMMISFDEYGVAFAPQGNTFHGRAGRIPHDTYLEFSYDHLNRPFRKNEIANTAPRGRGTDEMIRALGLTSVLLTLLRHSDRVKIGCMTGLIGAAIAYDRDHVWKRAAYYPFDHLNRFGQGISILPSVKSPVFDVKGFNLNEFHQMQDYADVPCIEAAATYNEEKDEAAVFIINRSANAIETEVDARGFEKLSLSKHIAMFDKSLDSINTFEKPNAIAPMIIPETKSEAGKILIKLEPYSWNVLCLA